VRAALTGSLFMGLSLGVVAAPCIGPFFLGLLKSGPEPVKKGILRRFLGK
jgi:hypothetical protein